MKLSNILYISGFGSIILSAINFVQGNQGSSDDKQHLGNFIGHWAPSFFILGKIVEDRERQES